MCVQAVIIITQSIGLVFVLTLFTLFTLLNDFNHL